MPTQEKTKERFCLFCDRRIEAGARPEKIYCNVDCKNNYNSRRRAELKAQGSPYQAEILKIIKNNYHILLHYKDDGKRLKRHQIPKQELIDQGFNADYITSIVEDKNMGLWKCCFDICVMDTGNDYFKLDYIPIEVFVDEDNPEHTTIAQHRNT